VFSNLLPGNDSFAAIRCNGNVISGLLLSNGRLALATLFRLLSVTSQYCLDDLQVSDIYDNILRECFISLQTEIVSEMNMK
jgi:hypothetical protein